MNVCLVAQPPDYLANARTCIQQKAVLCQSAGQWVVEAATQIAVESFDFALGLGAVGFAQSGDTFIMARKIQECRLIPVQAGAIGIATDDHGLDVVLHTRYILTTTSRTAPFASVTTLTRRENRVSASARES